MLRKHLKNGKIDAIHSWSTGWQELEFDDLAISFMNTPKTLRYCAPHQFVRDFTQSLAHKYLDEPAEEMDARINPWPGHHKNVMCWWKLANGYAVGWNENPAVGWSFPLIRLAARTGKANP